MAATSSSASRRSSEDIDESSLTHHETHHDDGDDFVNLKISDYGDTANNLVGGEQQQQQQFQKSANTILNERVAAYATKTYEKAVVNSKILRKDTDLLLDADCNDVAMVKFHELKVGKFLGNGSFSDVQ